MKKVVSGGTIFFTGVEQGSGKYSGDTLLLVRPSRMREAQIWLNENYGKTLKICNETEYETFVPQIQQNERENREKSDKELANEKKAMSVISIGRKYSKVVVNESDNSIETPKRKASTTKKTRKKESEKLNNSNA